MKKKLIAVSVSCLCGISSLFMVNNSESVDNLLMGNEVDFLQTDNNIIFDESIFTVTKIEYANPEIEYDVEINGFNAINQQYRSADISTVNASASKDTLNDPRTYYWADYDNATKTVLDVQNTGFIVHPSFKQKACYYTGISAYYVNTSKTQDFSVNVGMNIGIMSVGVSTASTSGGGVAVSIPEEMRSSETTLYVNVEYEVIEHVVRYYNAMNGRYAYSVYGYATKNIGEDYKVETC